MILLFFSLSGQFILDDVFQIKIADLRIAGGILLFLIAIKDIQVKVPTLEDVFMLEGIKEYMTKPVNLSDLLGRVKLYLGEAESSS